ncbi:cytosine permease [Klebsiella pneumoniae]|uniref:cytosine permease n=1 Tax=Klebsiella pneumoniae TaxID=573 RepID=UPI000E2C8F40|nr:cytosine permease [Klebsiella pneumoniae]MBZ7609527.1 cytosine permease [Klebsiella pneumoniae]SVO94573.1 cytosine/purine/uracil/thiamine/allantoin permease family protein [Klebsiella pneumoniae]SWH82154.1 cytosine/purine/uracil/thiamine/allantoin permease family protein [Klebsiella pneumoniae]SWS36266.1 cytosine/purine/uracil/thiamine/allantoin permease family protein [Klebsiella pneumoniae]SWS41991.1 cytosine/purine/uracil/thiamine/allantoin permease family protein [Klebsiella pneumoniae]
MSNSNDFPLVEAPAAGRKGVFSIAMVLFSFTFFTGTMFAGGKLGVSFSIVNLLWIAVIGNALLALYAASLGWIAARSGLNTVLMGRFCFGEIGSKLADFILGFAELGWYAWGTATVAISLVKILALPEALTQPLMVLFGILFCVTALVGYKGLDALSRLSVPLMFVLLMVSMYLALHHAGGWQAMTRIAPSDTMTWSAAITMVFGTFASGATQATNWTRLANSSRTAILASMGSFLIGNGLMIVAGAWCAIVYQQADIVEVMILQGLSVAAVIMLCLNLLTIQGPTIYNVSAAGVGIVLAIGGMYEMLIPFLVLLGSIIPPIGGVILADYWFARGGRYPLLQNARLPRFNWLGLGAYATGAVVAYLSPWIAPLVGISVSALVYIALTLLSKRQPAAVAEQEP